MVGAWIRQIRNICVNTLLVKLYMCFNIQFFGFLKYFELSKLTTVCRIIFVHKIRRQII